MATALLTMMTMGAAAPQAFAETTQTTDPRAELAARAAEKGLSERDRDTMLQHVRRIESAGFPVDAVVDRYLEGLSKNVPTDRIEAAVNELEGRLSESARRVDGTFPRNAASPRNAAKPDAAAIARAEAARLDLIGEGAYALASGVKPEGLSEVMRLAADAHEGPAGGKPAVFAMGCLMGSGLSHEESFRLVREAWMHGFRGGDLERLGSRVAGLGRDGAAPPRNELDGVLASIRRGDHEKVLRDLDRLNGDGDAGHGPGRHGPGDGRGGDESHRPAGPPDRPGERGHGGREGQGRGHGGHGG